MQRIRNVTDFADLVLKLHYDNVSHERIVEIVKERENYGQFSLEDVKKIISLHEEGEIP